MKNNIVLLIVLIFITSCNKQYDRAMKSVDKDFILEVADEQFEKKKWENVLNLYNHVKKLVAGTEDAKKVIFRSAYANYYNKNYRLAGNQFKNYSLTYNTDSLAEETLYLSAKCYYEGSLEYNLDQQNTNLAIKEMQYFVDKYPNSSKVTQANDIISELVVRNEKKAFENAKTYFKIGQYKASSIAFDNVIQDYPDTQYREELLVYILRSKTNLAKESIIDLKKERIIEAQTSYRNLLNNYPNSQFKNEADAIKFDLEKEMKIEQEREARIKEREARIKERNNNKAKNTI